MKALAAFCFIAMSFGAGCGPNINPPEPSNPNHAPAAKTSQDESYVPKRNVDVDEDVQEVVKYDCKNAVVSDVLEHRPENWMTLTKINPKKNIPADRGTFLNTTTGSTVTNAPLSGPKFYYVSTDEIKPNLLVVVSTLGLMPSAMKVVPGENTIQYKFETCAARDAQGICQRYDLQEEGEITLDVNVKQIRNPLKCELHPTCLGHKIIKYPKCNAGN